jgi:3-dehydroquinate dehydratase-2
MDAVLVLNGPNLNLVGEREPEIYGKITLKEISQKLTQLGQEEGFEVKCLQSNIEGELIDALQEARLWAKGAVFNPGGYTHTSVALRDTIAAIQIPIIEVHLTNIYARESFRHESLISPVCAGTITGFGWNSYMLGLKALINHINHL